MSEDSLIKLICERTLPSSDGTGFLDASVQTAAIQKSRTPMWVLIHLRRLPRYWTK